MSRIFLSPPDIRGDETEFVLRALASGWVAPVGPDLDLFEREIADLTGVAHGVGLSSGTAALHLALHQAGVTAGDTVLVSTFTFVASATPIAYLGATPLFVDCDLSTWNMSPELLADALRSHAKKGALPKACVVVDLYGQCADYDLIAPILDEYQIPLIEDAAEALGATYRGRAAGSFGRAGVLSFNGNKIITCSGGGMLLTDDPCLAEQTRHLATQARQAGFQYEHAEVGFNYRLSNVLAALGRGQLTTLAERIARRRQIRERYVEVLSTLPGMGFQPLASYGQSNCWLTCVTVDAEVAGVGAEDLHRHLESEDIETRPLWKPLHMQPAFNSAPAHLNGASERIWRNGLCLPSGSGMTDDDLERVIAAIGSLR